MQFRRRNKEPDNDQSVKALEDAQTNLKRINERTPEVSEVAKTLKWMRERNHFAETLQIIIEGGEL